MSLQDILDRIPQQWGKCVDVGEGWLPIVVDLDQQIAELDPNYTIAQVKEKFGGLRYYLLDIDPAAIDDSDLLIRAAENLAACTCENCGQPGTLRLDRSWQRTLCDPCSVTP